MLPHCHLVPEAGLKYRPNPLNPINIKKPFKVLAPLLAPLKMT